MISNGLKDLFSELPLWFYLFVYLFVYSNANNTAPASFIFCRLFMYITFEVKFLSHAANFLKKSFGGLVKGFIKCLEVYRESLLFFNI